MIKKQNILIILVLMIFSLVGCKDKGEDKLKKLSVPTNFQITGDTASWDEVKFAKTYRLSFTSGDVTMKRVVEETSVDLTTLSLPEGTYQVNIQAVGDRTNDSDYTTTNLTYTAKNLKKVTEFSGRDMLDSLYVKWNGRTLFNETKQLNMVYHSASGFEVRFKGESVTTRLYATNYTNGSTRPYVVIVVDEDFENMRRVALTAQYTDLVLVEGILDDAIHKVTLYKSTESTDSHIGVEKISTTGEFIQDIDLKERKIEFIAASSSTGYGDLAASSSVTKTSENSDCMQAFSGITARMLNADFSIYAASGWGVKASSWTNSGENLFDAYKKYDFRGEGKEVPYVYSSFIPDVIVINLGTNDYSYINAGSTEAIKHQRLIDFKEQYSAFLEFLHDIYPNCHIVILHGVMNEAKEITESTIQIYEGLKNKIENLSIIKINGDGKGSNSHPSLASHQNIAEKLVAHIKEQVGW